MQNHSPNKYKDTARSQYCNLPFEIAESDSQNLDAI